VHTKIDVLGVQSPHIKNGVFDVFNRRKILLQAAGGRTAYRLKALGLFIIHTTCLSSCELGSESRQVRLSFLLLKKSKES